MNTYVVFDVETPNKRNNRMSAIGISVIEENRIVDSFYSLVNPETHFDTFNVQLTGISEQDVLHKANFKELWPILKSYFERGILVAHNAKFDMSVLASCLKAYEIEWKKEAEYVCTLDIAYRAFRNIENRKLNTICNYLNIDLDHHNAESDALACAKIMLYYMQKGFNINRFVKTYKLPVIRKNIFSSTLCSICGEKYNPFLNHVCPHCDGIDFNNIRSVEILQEEELTHIEKRFEFDPVQSAYLTQMDGWQHFEGEEVEEEVFDGILYTFLIHFKDHSSLEKTYKSDSTFAQKLLEYIKTKEQKNKIRFVLPENIENLFPSRIKSRGYDLYRAGAILDCFALDENRVIAKVKGTVDYTVSITKEKDSVQLQCNCPYTSLCKHEYAFIQHIKNHPEFEIREEEVRFEHTPLEDFTLYVSELEYDMDTYEEDLDNCIENAIRELSLSGESASVRMQMLFVVMQKFGVEENVWNTFKSLLHEDARTLHTFKACLKDEYLYSYIAYLGIEAEEEDSKEYINFVSALLEICNEEEKDLVEEAIFPNRILRKLTRHLFGYSEK